MKFRKIILYPIFKSLKNIVFSVLLVVFVISSTFQTANAVVFNSVKNTTIITKNVHNIHSGEKNIHNVADHSINDNSCCILGCLQTAILNPYFSVPTFIENKFLYHSSQNFTEERFAPLPRPPSYYI